MKIQLKANGVIIDAEMAESVKQALVNAGAAVEVKEPVKVEEKKIESAPENKMIDNSPENKQRGRPPMNRK